MNVTVDGPRRQGHGRCYQLAPEVFVADEEGMASVVSGPWTPARVGAAHRGLVNCPEGAILVEPDQGDS